MSGELDSSVFNKILVKTEYCDWVYENDDPLLTGPKHNGEVSYVECSSDYFYGAKAFLEMIQEGSYVVIICLLLFVGFRILFFSKK